MREAVIATTLEATVPVMTSSDVDIESVELHADVLAFVEGYRDATNADMPWSSLLAAAAAVPPDHELLRIGSGVGGRASAAVSATVQDLMILSLITTGPEGLRITETGCAAVRRWNGAYKARLDAARTLLRDAQILPV